MKRAASLAVAAVLGAVAGKMSWSGTGTSSAKAQAVSGMVISWTEPKPFEKVLWQLRRTMDLRLPISQWETNKLITNDPAISDMSVFVPNDGEPFVALLIVRINRDHTTDPTNAVWKE